MRIDTILGLLGATGLWGLSSAQGYSSNSPGTTNGGGTTSSGSGSGSAISSQATCPFSHPTTVFVTVTPTVSSNVFSTVVSTVTIGVSPSSGSSGQGGSVVSPSGTSYHHSGTGPLSWSPAGVSETYSGPWSTDYLTLTLPPASGQATSSMVTYTIVSPADSNSNSVNSGSHLQTITPTSASGGTRSAPFTITETIPAGGAGNSETTGTPSNTGHHATTSSPLTLTVTLPNSGNGAGKPSSSGGLSPEGSNGPGGQGGVSIVTTLFSPTSSQTEVPWVPFGGGGSEGSQPLPTITITLPGGLPSGPKSEPLQTFTVTIPSGEAGDEPQTLTITAPNGSPTLPSGYPTDANGGSQPLQTYTITVPSGEAGSQPQTLTITAPNGLSAGPNSSSTGPSESPTAPYSENQPCQTFTVTIPGGEAGSQPQTLTITVTIPSGEAGTEPQTLTITAPNGSPTGPNESPTAAYGGNQPLETFTVTIPNSEAGGESQTLTITTPCESPTSSTGSAGSPPLGTFTVTIPSGEAGTGPQTVTITAPTGLTTSSNGAVGGSQPLQTFTVTIPSGEAGSEPHTLTITAPNGSPTSSTGTTGESQPVQTIIVTAPDGLSTFTFTVPEQSSSGYSSEPSQGGSQALPTITITVPTGSATGNGGGPGFSEPLATITLTIPGQSATGSEGGSGGSQPPQTLTLTIPPEPSSGPTGGAGSGGNPLPTFTVTIPAPPGETGLQTVTLTATEGSPSNSPTPPCTESGPGASGVPSASNTGGSPFPVITLTLSEEPFGPTVTGLLPNTEGPPFSVVTLTLSEEPFGSSVTGLLPQVSASSSSSSETTLFPPQESGDTAANSNPAPSTAFASSSSGPQGTEGPGSPSPVPTNFSHGPFSSLPSSGWNFSTSASQEGPVGESTTSSAAPNPSETTCTDSTTQAGASIPTSLTPSFPPPVSPAPIPPGEGPTVTSALESTVAVSGSETAAGCVSMTTLVISTMTFSWCDQVAFSTTAGASATGVVGLQNGRGADTNLLSSTLNSGGYEFGSGSADKRSPALADTLHKSVHTPSTLATVVIPSRLGEGVFSPSETPNCGGDGDLGNFTLNFDDFPTPDASSENQPKYLSDPYHRFYYAGGFSVVAPLSVPFRPSSGDLMLQFTPSSISNTPEDGVPPDTADIGVGPQAAVACFSFNFTGVKLGCDSKEAPCSFAFTGFKYDPSEGNTVEAITQTVIIPACPDTENCTLTPVTVSYFNDLTSITIKAEVNGEPTIWWLDDFAFGWFDNTCDSGLCRSRLPNGIQKRGWAVKDRQATSKLVNLIGARGW